ncbi:hypothetical protein NP439_05350 [Oceanobacillus jeddahense]|uniref:Phage protein n=1 Tax=Oceanobacillus jeddahense TaxID=1462527 RepID=A0ABY5JUT8_9BACI|nr:hypothetical protein [Oceanobacillus jeddahense]UUI04113.1 hypothetical protein NP439_05350 [Oceanobacillus jeddahense]
MARKKYYVTVDTEEISEVSLPDNGIEYEIYATPEEVKEIEVLFTRKEQNAKDAVKFVGKPFDERPVDAKRANYEGDLIALYRKLYDLGTDETKKEIKELRLF